MILKENRGIASWWLIMIPPDLFEKPKTPLNWYTFCQKEPNLLGNKTYVYNGLSMTWLLCDKYKNPTKPNTTVYECHMAGFRQEGKWLWGSGAEHQQARTLKVPLAEFLTTSPPKRLQFKLQTSYISQLDNSITLKGLLGESTGRHSDSLRTLSHGWILRCRGPSPELPRGLL